MPPAFRANLCTVLAITLSGWISLVSAQTADTKSVFSKLPAATTTSEKQKRQLRSARTYADRQRILKQHKQGARPTVRRSNGMGLKKQQDNSQRAKRSVANGSARTFGPRQRVRNQSRLRGGAPAR